MRVLVDADACPVKEIIVEVCKDYNVEVIMFADTSHLINLECTVITLDKGCDSVDIAIANSCNKNDIVVTQDYGVASMVLGAGCYAINQNGLIYNKENIDRLMFERFLSQKSRRAGLKGSKHRKRTKENNNAFKSSFIKLLNIAKEQ
ncbi:hypothetical protein SAMN05660462_01677 [Proteiniborus ethanoligenes]|uniref:UPF0178 protein SAMN05660462_01677 n=1 Tax=Proteiniborus ethanoligenes TaxID=415015 RepID=A0A1H3PXK8_9FIRM|nr:YaiI/YqxD family protein [Proteiniborus ethanoligenes]TAH63965.1 MAG: YaiI/YqxD family protein [Gottschalkiaceae bacterium]SDZ05730.1 hypothetical protein SAMN05660462_01677 [Proteiniborus ethanoligenes]